MTTTAAPQTLLPVEHGLTPARMAALLGVAVPPSAVVAVISQQSGNVLPAALLIGLAVLSVVAAVAVSSSTRIVLEPGLVRTRRLGDVGVLRSADVARAVRRRIENRDELGSQRHLFILDGTGRTLLRMSDRWWTEEQMARIVAHLGAAVETTDESVYLSELRRSVPEQLRWQERHAWAWVMIRAAAVGAGALVVAALGTAAL